MIDHFRCKLFFALVLSIVRVAGACPTVGSISDFNCDGRVSVVIVGDSLVAGVGDSAKVVSGGYVVRAQARLPDVQMRGYGFPGLRTQQLLSKLRKSFGNIASSELAKDISEADLVVLDLGRNDRWLFGLPQDALRNLNRARAIIQAEVQLMGAQSPLVVLPQLMLPNRGSQGPWVKELNELIAGSHTTSTPADLRFNLVSKRLLSVDNLHPSSKGYAALAEVLVKYITVMYPQHVADLRGS